MTTNKSSDWERSPGINSQSKNPHITATLQGIQAANTKRAYERALNLFDQWLIDKDAPIKIGRDSVLAYLDNLRESNADSPKSPAYYKQTLAAIKRLAKTMADSRDLDYLEYLAIQSIEAEKSTPVKKGYLIPPETLKNLLEVCKAEKKPMGTRDAAIIAVLSATGMRRDECAALTLGVFDERQKRIEIKGTKNHKDRFVYLNDGAASYLADWLAIRGKYSGPLFTRINIARRRKDGTQPQVITKAPLTGAAIYKMLDNRSVQTGLEIKIKPHDFRKTFITLALARNEDILSIARLTGHESLEVIKSYDLGVDERAKEAAQRMDTPYIE